MSGIHREKDQTTVIGPFGKVALEFSFDENGKQDRLKIVFYDEKDQIVNKIHVGSRVSPSDGAVLLTAFGLEGDEI